MRIAFLLESQVGDLLSNAIRGQTENYMEQILGLTKIVEKSWQIAGEKFTVASFYHALDGVFAHTCFFLGSSQRGR